jgi:hypothetical protein
MDVKLKISPGNKHLRGKVSPSYQNSNFKLKTDQSQIILRKTKILKLLLFTKQDGREQSTSSSASKNKCPAGHSSNIFQ